jgi:hypothetical protein
MEFNSNDPNGTLRKLNSQINHKRKIPCELRLLFDGRMRIHWRAAGATCSVTGIKASGSLEPRPFTLGMAAGGQEFTGSTQKDALCSAASLATATGREMPRQRPPAAPQNDLRSRRTQQ